MESTYCGTDQGPYKVTTLLHITVFTHLSAGALFQFLMFGIRRLLFEGGAF
jgi:hypothetical protein